jgi:hypothetical protein
LLCAPCSVLKAEMIRTSDSLCTYLCTSRTCTHGAAEMAPEVAAFSERQTGLGSSNATCPPLIDISGSRRALLGGCFASISIHALVVLRTNAPGAISNAGFSFAGRPLVPIHGLTGIEDSSRNIRTLRAICSFRPVLQSEARACMGVALICRHGCP